MTPEEKAAEANYLGSLSKLNELVPKDWSDESYERLKDSYLKGITYETWKRYVKEHPERLKENKEEEDDRKELKLPCAGKLISSFADEVADILKKTKTIFYRPSAKEVLEICELKDEDKEDEYVGFSELKSERFITVAEKYILPYVKIKEKNQYGQMEFVEREKSMSPGLAKTVLESPNLQNKLPKINRIFTTPIPIIYDGKLTFPKKGYDKRFQSWMPLDAPEINDGMSLEEAKGIIQSLYSEFCFQERQDYIHAIAGLITPFLRGLFPTFRTRTPFFLYIANRERAGKDYCAGITGLVYEGHALEEPPISNGEKNGGSANDELRKKLLSSLMAGRKRLHFSNNKGYINNAILEGFLTSEKYSDRALGRNEVLTFDNEIDVSGSGNVGVGFTADLANRTRFVRLFLEIEDANARKFNNPTLHNWVRHNRGLILSAMYALVRNWFEKECPDGTQPYSSFPEWARVCGGVMEAAGYDNPCKTDKEVLAIGGDVETNDMKMFFEYCYEQRPEEWIPKTQLTNMLENAEEDMFAYLDLSKRADQTKFGLKISKFAGRVLGGIKMKLEDSSVRASRQKFMFTREFQVESKEEIFKDKVEGGNLGNNGNVYIPSRESKMKIDYINGIAEVANITKVAKSTCKKAEKVVTSDDFTPEELAKAGLSEEDLQ